jgi:hypothetical protein
MTALAVFGEDCFYETASDVKFKSDVCFFGNVHVKLDFLDSTSNFYEGFFNEATILQLLTTMMSYDPINIYTKVSEPVMDIKF